MKLLLDLAIFAIIAISVWSGYKKGLIMGIGGIFVLILSIVVGNALSSAYSQDVISAMRPFASGYTDKLFTAGVYSTLGVEDSEYSIEDLLAQDASLGPKAAKAALSSLGLYDDAADTMTADAVKYYEENGGTMSGALTEVVCKKVAFAGAFLLFFILTAIILTVIGNLTNLSFRIPYLGSGNEIGGAICGLIEGMMICLALAWVLRFGGIVFPNGILGDTWVLSFLMEHNLLASYLGI